MQMSSIVCVFACLVCGQAAVLRGQVESLSLSLEESESADWAALSEAESEDRSFLLSQLDQTETELMHLQKFLEASGMNAGMIAGLQISATPTDKKAAAPVAKAAAPAAKTEAKKEVAKPAVDEDPAKVMASLGIHLGGAGGLKGAAALVPMLGMLKGLYQDSKDRISQQNTREEKSKKWFASKEAEHKAKLDQIEGKFKNHTLSEEFRTNETRDENRYFTYWSRCRQRQHRQFHTNLKIQHAMMMKVKKMIDTYEKAISTKPADQAKAKKQLSAMTGMPEIVFLQDVQRTVGNFCRESLTEVRKEKAELQEAAKEGIAF